MNRAIRQIFRDMPSDTRLSIVALYVVLIAANLGTWAWAWIVFHAHPVLLATALLAYGYGLRHAVDADHIAAIDNVVRSQMQQGRRPVAAGFYFSLGHSTVVLLLSGLVAFSAGQVQSRFQWLKDVGGVVGTSISAFFLLLVAVMNIFILLGTLKTFRRVSRGGRYNEEDMDTILARGGLLAHLFRPVFSFIRRSWHMYPLGFLFGLGFDTATEVALLTISAAEASKGLPVWSVMVFPALFTAGMALVDTTDGILMLGAYGWAFLNPLRKLFYNITVTAVSVVVALLVGGIEALGLIGDHFQFSGRFWDCVGSLNENFYKLGYLIIGIFAICWMASMALYRMKGYDKITVTSNLPVE